MEEKIWNVLQALDPSIGSFPTRTPNENTVRAQKRFDIYIAVEQLAFILRETFKPELNDD